MLAFVPTLVVIPLTVERFIPYTDFNIEMAYLQTRNAYNSKTTRPIGVVFDRHLLYE